MADTETDDDYAALFVLEVYSRTYYRWPESWQNHPPSLQMVSNDAISDENLHTSKKKKTGSRSSPP